MYHYAVLEIDRNATLEGLKKAYKAKALKYHPDKHIKNGMSREDAEKAFNELNESYEVLSERLSVRIRQARE